MKKIFTFVVALMTVLTISAQGQKTNVWSGTQAMDGMFPFTVDASAFAGVTADQKLSITVADVAAGAYVQAYAGDYATELIPYTEIAAAGDVVFELTATAVNSLKSSGIVLMGGVYTITSIDLVAGQVEPDPTPGTVEAYFPTDETGVAKAEWVAEANPTGNVVDINATANVHLYALSGPETGWTDGTTLPLEAQYNNGWAVKNNRNNVWDDALGATKTLYFINGGGNPTTGVAFAAKYKDDVATGDYRRSYRTADDPTGPWFDETGKEFTGDYDFYYSPDGSKGLPKYGAYYKVTAKTDGVMKFLVWNNKGNRKAYVVDGETAVALDPLKGEVKYSGYVNGKDEYIDSLNQDLGKKMIYYELAATEDNPYCLQAEINQGQAAWIYMTFNMTAGKEYWLFNENTQLGFGGFEFTPAAVEAEEYIALTTENVLAPEFAAIVDPETQIATNVVDGSSKLNFSTANMDCEAVSSSNPNDVECSETEEFGGWTAGYMDIKWEKKNQGDISYYYVLGAGNPAVIMGYTKKESSSAPNGYVFTPDWTYYMSDGSNGLPKMGLYYKFTPKCDGALSIKVWANKGNRRTFFVDDATMKALPYEVEGYINGQNEKVWDPTAKDGAGDSVNVKRWLTNDEIQALHDGAGKTDPEDAYIIGAGNQPFWGNINVNVQGGKTYWLFQHSSQVGFAGYKFTPGAVPTPPTPAGLKGDADEDEVVTVSDITTIASYILGNTPSPFNFDNADVDNDGSITVSDITGTAGIILGK